MGIRINRNLKSPDQPTNGFDISGVEGKEYNLEQIEESRSRNASQSPLAVHVDSKKGTREGGITIGGDAEKLNISNLEYKKYLLSESENNSSSSINSGSPVFSLKRPIIFWEDGSIDENATRVFRSIYDEVAELKELVIAQQNEINELKEKIAERIDVNTNGEELVTNKNSIPTVGAVFNYIKGLNDDSFRYDYLDGETFGLQNGSLTGGDENYGATLNDNDYRLHETDINEFGIVIGGNNG